MLAVQCTEVFEYGMSLGNVSYQLPMFHLFKYLYLLRLIDYGLLEEVSEESELFVNSQCTCLMILLFLK